MKDVRIDASGEFRCWNCSGKNFTEKRTFRAKAAVGVGALLTKKKLKCQQCGKYNDVGSAKYTGPETTPASVAPSAAPSRPVAPAAPRESFAPAPREPIAVKGTMGRIEFDGTQITVHRSMQGSTTIPLDQLIGIRVYQYGLGGDGIWFARDGRSEPTKKTITTDPAGLMFPSNRRDDFDQLVAAIGEHRVDAPEEPTVVEPTASTPPPPPSVPAGWYPDPQGQPVQRYWDGGAWTEHTAPEAP